MLEINNISVSLSNKPVLQQLSLTIPSSEFAVIIGANGVGKSTLLRAISGELELNSGQIKIFGRDAKQWNEKELATRMAVLPQSSQLNFPMLVEDVVGMGRLPHSTGKALDQRLAERAIKELDLCHIAEKPYTELSGGEKQRVQLARVLVQVMSYESNESGKKVHTAMQDKLLVLDEPTNSLDIEHQHLLMRLLKRLKIYNTSVIAVLHDFNLAAQYADSIISISNQRVDFYGEPSQVFTEDYIERVFKVKAHILTHPESKRPVISF